MLIRKATEADLEGVSACLTEAFEPYRDLYTPAGFTDTVLTVETARRRLAHMTILVADAGGAIVGTIGYQAGADGEGHLRGMAVRAPSQGSGIARALLAAAEAGLRAHRCTRVTLDTTRPLERAIAFYERHGYTTTGTIRDFYGMELIEYEKALPPA
jgi:ribosomal protein S18 acetylase RimI-like enzyme